MTSGKTYRITKRIKLHTKPLYEVDGKTIKEDTFYMLKNGKFVIEK